MSQDITDAQNPPVLIDAKGLKCPMPVIKLQQAIRTQPNGQVLAIECTDLSAPKDIGSWCRVNKHQFLKADPCDFGIICWVKVIKSTAP